MLSVRKNVDLEILSSITKISKINPSLENLDNLWKFFKAVHLEAENAEKLTQFNQNFKNFCEIQKEDTIFTLYLKTLKATPLHKNFPQNNFHKGTLTIRIDGNKKVVIPNVYKIKKSSLKGCEATISPLFFLIPTGRKKRVIVNQFVFRKAHTQFLQIGKHPKSSYKKALQQLQQYQTEKVNLIERKILDTYPSNLKKADISQLLQTFTHNIGDQSTLNYSWIAEFQKTGWLHNTSLKPQEGKIKNEDLASPQKGSIMKKADCDLHEFLQNLHKEDDFSFYKKNTPFLLGEISKYFEKGEFFIKNGLIPTDIKPENILITKEKESFWGDPSGFTTIGEVLTQGKFTHEDAYPHPKIYTFSGEFLLEGSRLDKKTGILYFNCCLLSIVSFIISAGVFRGIQSKACFSQVLLPILEDQAKKSLSCQLKKSVQKLIPLIKNLEQDFSREEIKQLISGITEYFLIMEEEDNQTLSSELYRFYLSLNVRSDEEFKKLQKN